MTVSISLKPAGLQEQQSSIYAFGVRQPNYSTFDFCISFSTINIFILKIQICYE